MERPFYKVFTKNGDFQFKERQDAINKAKELEKKKKRVHVYLFDVDNQGKNYSLPIEW